MKHNGVEIIVAPSLKLLIEGTEQTSFFIDPPYLSGMEMGEQNRGAREKFDTIEAFYERLLVFLSGNYPDNKRGLIHCFVNNRYFKPGHVTRNGFLICSRFTKTDNMKEVGLKIMYSIRIDFFYNFNYACYPPRLA